MSVKQSGPSSVTRVSIPHTSWKTNLIWWSRRFIKFLFQLPIIGPRLLKFPTPLKGQQLWPRPFNLTAINQFLGVDASDNEKTRAVVEEWEETSTGWNMPVFFPPLKYGGKDGTERIVLYFYGGAFLAPP